MGTFNILLHHPQINEISILYLFPNKSPNFLGSQGFLKQLCWLKSSCAYLKKGFQGVLLAEVVPPNRSESRWYNIRTTAVQLHGERENKTMVFEHEQTLMKCFPHHYTLLNPLKIEEASWRGKQGWRISHKTFFFPCNATASYNSLRQIWHRYAGGEWTQLSPGILFPAEWTKY